MASHSSDDELAELLYAPDDVTPARQGDDLLSQLAGESIDRMMSGEFEPIVNPVEKLTDQLDTFFEELQHRRHMKSVAPASLASAAALPQTPAQPKPIADDRAADDEAQFEVYPNESAALEARVARMAAESSSSPARAMLVGADDIEADPRYLRVLDWVAAPIEALSSAGRIAVGLTAVASFLAACGTLAWVMALRQGQ